MKNRLISIVSFILIATGAFAQTPSEVYSKQLNEVLEDISARYSVRISYDANTIKDIRVPYAFWRYRSDIEKTLQNILLPYDLIFTRTGENEYWVNRFEYWKRTPAEGKQHLDKLLSLYPSLADWESRKVELKHCFLEQLGLNPFPAKTPLNPIHTTVRKFDGYSVENIAIETLPGVYLCGSLYKPLKRKGPFPAILCPHGHFSSTDLNEYGRYRPDQQYRCASLARMGAVVFSYEMFAWGESLLQVKSEDHKIGLALTMQTLNSIRVIDFLCSLPYVDQKRIGITGESGGGTQTFLCAALDNRIAVSVPVVMVSSYFYGGCACESGLPIHSCTTAATNNAEIAAMASPRPMLVISDGDDWTSKVPDIEYPYLKKVYELYGKADNVENVHFKNEGHDYGFSKRKVMYDFMARKLGLDISAVRNKNGEIDESGVTIENYVSLLVFGSEGRLPAGAVRGSDAVRDALRSSQK